MIGFESGSDKMLVAMQKNTTRAENIQATKLLKKYGIDVICGGLVIGCEGESEETLTQTLEFIRDIKKIGNTCTMMSTPLIPLPGSICFERLLKKLSEVTTEKYWELFNSDILNLEELVELWNYNFSDVSLSRLIQFCVEVETMFPIGIKLIDLHPNKL